MASESHGAVYLSTLDAYNKWAAVYDIDGNVLQAVDDYMLEECGLLAVFLESVVSSHSPNQTDSVLQLIDFGAGTGRNSLKLILSPILQNLEIAKSLLLLDFSSNMLQVARQRCDGSLNQLVRQSKFSQSCLNFKVDYRNFDALSPNAREEEALGIPHARAIISTLVVEHIPLEPYFAAISDMFGSKQPGTSIEESERVSANIKEESESQWDWLLITNMHSDMGFKSQAGFIDPTTGRKIRPKSYAHTAREIIEEGGKWGFEPLDLSSLSGYKSEATRTSHFADKAGTLFLERAIADQDLENGLFGGKSGRGRKWIGVNVWYGIIMRRKRWHPSQPRRELTTASNQGLALGT